MGQFPRSPPGVGVTALALLHNPAWLGVANLSREWGKCELRCSMRSARRLQSAARVGFTFRSAVRHHPCIA